MNKYKSKTSRALVDLMSCATHRKLWSHLGWNDIRQKYAGSILGPFWITLSLALYLVAFGFVYSRLFHQSLSNYVPFLTGGFLAWAYISGVFIDSCDVFVASKPYIYQVQLPYTLYLYRIIWKNLIIFLHNLAVYFIVLILFTIHLSGYTLLFFPGMLLVTINITGIGLIISIIATRYRDIPPIINTIMQVLFFVSPVTWMPHLIGRGSLILHVNPIYYFLDLIRSPLLGDAPKLHSWEFCLCFAVLVYAVAIPLFIRKRASIPYWI